MVNIHVGHRDAQGFHKTGGIIDDAALEAHLGLSKTAINVVSEHGADNTGSTATHTKIQAAINAAAAKGGGTVYIPAGTYSIGTAIALADNVSLTGAGQGITVLKARAGLATAVVLGKLADTVSNLSITNLTIDGAFSTNGLKISGVQISAGTKISIRHVTILNVGAYGVAYGSGTTDSIVENCVVTGTGLHSGDMHGLSISNASHRNKIRNNRVTGGRAMGIYVGVAGTGSTDCEISGNYVETIHTTGQDYECIGVTANCLRTIVIGNHCVDSDDNGISITAAECVVSANIIEGCNNAGIAVAGNNCAITGNRIHNPGKDFPTTGTLWGGIALNEASHCVVVGNVIYDDQTVFTMSYGIKEVGTANGNVIIGNRARGFRLSEYLRTGAATLALVGARPTVAGSRGGNAAVASLLTALSGAGLINDTTVA